MSRMNALPPPVTRPEAASWATPPSRPARNQRRAAVQAAKYLLPVMALALLSSIALWPELSRTVARGRVTWRLLTAISRDAGRMLHPRYHGLDERAQPYTVSADTATRAGLNRIDLKAPVGDLTLQNGTWLLLQSRTGVFIEHASELDLQDDVKLYRQDGTILTSATATVNLKQGAATSNDFTHAEGPFGTLDAQGFTLVDRGGVVQFHGPARLVMNAAH